MKKKLFSKTIAIFLVICYLNVFCLQDAVYAKTDDKPVQAQSSKGSGNKSSGSGKKPKDDSETMAALSSLSAEGGAPSSFGSGNLNVSALQLFQNNLFAGKATMSVPIAVPTGRNNVHPSIGLAYSSQSGNGICGVDWSMSLDSIRRSTKRGVPLYDDNKDSFIFASSGGTQELVKVASGTYRAKIESAFLRYEYNGSRWVVTDKQGTKYYFGQTSGSRQQSGSSKIYAWYLDKVLDIKGNFMLLTYQHDQSQIYPDSISYTGNELQDDEPRYSVTFSLEGRPDTTFSYRTGIKIATARRIKEIRVKYGQDLIRKYALRYQQSSSSSRSILKEVQQYGSDGTTALPAITFGYLNKNHEFDILKSWGPIDKGDSSSSSFYFLRSGEDNRRVDIFDINGDGLPDRVMQGDYDKNWEVQLNTDDGFGGSIAWHNIDNLRISNYYYLLRYEKADSIAVDIFDINGDGLPDRVMQDKADSDWEVQLNTGTGF
ncbi:SpvB/TcaC N-terminal domain-containing protein, partial [Candidatus Omnitrophota bacterium]